MRYHSEPQSNSILVFGNVHICNHPVYTRCTLYKNGARGLAIIQQRYDPLTKHTWWTEVDPWLANQVYLNEGFVKYFGEHSAAPVGDIFPTVTIRQIMWALRMKPLKRERWETLFDHRYI